MNFQIRSVRLARDECARCGRPWRLPEWDRDPVTAWTSPPVACIKADEDFAEVWCDDCVRVTSPKTMAAVEVDRLRFFSS